MKKIKASLIGIFMIVLAISCDTQKRDDNVEANEFEKATTEKVTFERKDEEQKVDVLINGVHITSYIYPSTIKKPVLYPVKTLSGKRITRGFPFEAVPGERVDHPHHVGLWFTYGDVNGLDFWNNSDSIKLEDRDKYGTILHKSINEVVSGEKGQLSVTLDWVDPDGNKLMEENTTFVFTGGEKEYWIDRITKLTAVKDISMKDNKEGVLGIRVTRELEHPSDQPQIYTDANGKATEVPAVNNEGVVGNYLNAEGIEGTATWGKRSPWVNLRSKISGEDISLVILDHKQNVGYPTYWHSRGYGLFAANPLGQEVFSNGKEALNYNLKKGESTTFRHRVIVANKQMETETLNQRFNQFSETTN